MSSIYINELRMSLKQISNLTALKYQALGLSTGHKKRIEYELTYDFDRISLFEGDVLFCVTNQNSPRQDEQDKVSGFLAQKIRNYSSKSLEWIKLNTLPERTLERIIMAMISAQAARNGFFTIYGRTLFKPTNQKGKLAHLAVEATLFLDNDFVKIYLTPSWIALKNIKETYRTQRYDLELVGLCEHRVGCTLAREDGSCPYIHVGKLGYYSEELPLDKLSKDRQQSLANYFQECPQLLDIREVVLVKASKRAQNTFAYPTFSVYAKLLMII